MDDSLDNVDEGSCCEELDDSNYFVDDYFETHDIDDLQEWEAEQVFQDNEGDS